MPADINKVGSALFLKAAVEKLRNKRPPKIKLIQ